MSGSVDQPGFLQPLTTLPECVPTPPLTNVTINSTDLELLLAFKDSFANGAEVLADWVGDSPCTEWQGVTCDMNDQVTSM